MMEFPTIDFKTLARYQGLQYLQYKQPLVEYVNRAIQDPALMEHAMDSVKEIYADWVSNRDKKPGRIFSSRAVYKFLGVEEASVASCDDIYLEAEFLLSYCLGIYCNDRKDINIVSLILDLSIDDDWTGFANTFNPDRELLMDLICSEMLDQEKLMSDMISRRRCDEGFEEYYESLSLEHKIKSIDSPNFESEFFVLYEYLILPSTLITKYGDYALYAEFLRRYTLPQIQQQALTALEDPEQILALFNAISSTADKEDKSIVLKYVLIHSWYSSLLSATKNYAQTYTGSDASLNEVWHELSEEFKAKEDEMIISALQGFIDALDPVSVSKWLLSKKTLAPPRETIDSKITNQVMVNCKEKALSLIGCSGFDPSIHNMAYLSSFAEYFTENECEKELYNHLWLSILEAIKSDKYYLSGNISDDLIRRIHILAEFVNIRVDDELESDFEKTLKDFHVRYEGLMATPVTEQNDKASAESQFLLIYLYLTSFIEDKDLAERLFDRISNYALRQCSYSPNRIFVDEYYQRVLDLCELIADQCLPVVKERYESNCISIFPDIATLISIFVKSKSAISDEAKEWLRNEGQHDWKILKNRLNSRHQTQYGSNLEMALQNICLSDKK